MNWGVRGRLLYLTLVLAVLALVALGIWYRTRPAPSCFDGKLNQGELETDCGGSCARVCPFETKPLKEVWSRIFAGAPGRYDVATFLKNPNPRHAARSFAYRLKLFDRAGILVTTQESEAFANPGESFFLYSPRLEVGNRLPERVVFEIVDGPVWQRLEPASLDLKIAFKSFTNTPSPLLLAEAENASLSDLRDIQVVTVLSDEEQNALAVSATLIDKLEKGRRQEISFTWPVSLPREPVFFDFYPHFDWALSR